VISTDGLIKRKSRIEKKLAERHVSNDCLVLSDISGAASRIEMDKKACPSSATE